MIRAIVFDCFGVLTSDKWKEFIAAQPADKVQAIRDIHTAFDKHLISYSDFQKQVAELSGASDRELDDVFLQKTIRPKNEPLFVFIQTLKQQYKIAILSNVGTGWIRDEFLTADEQQLFDTMVFSYEVGYAKPDPEMYEITAERLSVPANQCVMIDDSQPNIDGALAAGWQAILYHDLTQLKSELLAKMSQ